MPLRKESTPSNHSTRNLTYQAMPPPSNNYEECQISHCMAGPWKFYLQFKQQIESYRKLQGKLKLYFETGKLGRSSLKIGSSVLCHIKNMVEEEYQRGLITGEGFNDEVPVYLVDKGATLKLRKDLIWELPVELLATPICMFKCCLDGLPVIVDSEVTNAFGEVVVIHPLKGKIVRLDEVKLIKVSLLASGCDVLKMIIPSFKKSKLVTNCKATISYICKKNDIIYMHLSNESHELEKLQRKLQERSHSAVIVENPKVDMVYLGHYKDGCWYRAICLETRDYIKVKYVDYGNIEVVSPGSIRELSLDLIRELPAQAIPCVLNDVPMKWVTSELVEEISGPIGEIEFHVKMICTREIKLEGISEEVAVVEMISETGVSFNFSLQAKLKMDIVGAASSIPSGANSVIGKDVIKNENPKMLLPGQERSFIVNKFGVSKVPGVEVKPGMYGQVRLSYVGRACFFVTLLEKEKLIQDIKEVMKKCQGMVKKGVEGLSTGWLVASFDNYDKMWHRGLVTGCVGQLVELTLIDSGRDLVIERSLLQKLPDTPLVLSTPAQAIKCTLSDGSLNSTRLEHMKKDIGSCFLTHFYKEENGVWEVRLYDEKIVGGSGGQVAENTTLPYESERTDNAFSKERPSKHCKEESKPVTSFLKDISNSYVKDSTNNNADMQDQKLVEEMHWKKPNTQHLSTPGPIRNKSHRYHGASAGDKWRDGSNGSGKAVNSQWRGKNTSSTSSTQSEETLFEKPGRRTREFGLFRNRSQNEVPDIPLKANRSQMPNLNRNTYDKDSRSFSEVKNQVKKWVSRRSADEEFYEKSKGTEDSFRKSSHSDDSWSDNQNKQNGNTKERLSIPPNKIICDYEFSAIIVYVEDDGSLWIQACSQIPVLDKLMDDINDSCVYSLQVLTATPEIGQPYLCLYAEDGRYYRALVKEVCDNDHTLVHYVDYGNSNEVKASDMRLIPSSFCHLPCQAVHCYFSKILREQSIEVLHQNITEILSEELKITLSLELQDEHCLIVKSCRVRDLDILSKIHEEQMSKENVSRSVVQVNQIKAESNGYIQIPHLTVDYEAEMRAHICHIDNDGIFWAQLTDNIVALEEIMERLNEVVNPSNITLLPSPVPGMPCLCQYSEDQRFYRAEVKEVLAMEGTTSVLYVDYGNVDSIKKENLAVLPEEFMAFPRQAICCSFSKEIRSKWSHSTQSCLEAFIEQECVLALVEKSDDSGTKSVIVKFDIDGVDILSCITSKAEIDGVGSEVVEDNVSISEASIPILSLSYNSEIAANVSHVENSLLWIQLVDQSPALVEMEEKLNECTLLPLTGAPKIGCVYACRFADDERLYRAVVKDVDANGLGVTVHYIDHGNDSHAGVDNLFVIPSSLVTLPRQAILCHFEKENDCLMTIDCMDELLNQEVAVSLSRSTEENRNILSSCKLDGKELFLVPQCVPDESNEKGELLNEHEAGGIGLDSIEATVSPVFSEASFSIPSCSPIKLNEIFKAYVCHVEIDSIWIQHADQLEELEERMEKLNENPPTVLQTIPACNSLCVAQYSIDGRYYRCVIQEISDESSALVHFVDYGNSEKVAIGDLYEIPDYFQSLPRQAIRCYFKEKEEQVDLQSLLEQVLEISVHMEEKVDETVIVLDICSFNDVNVLPDCPEVIPGDNLEKKTEESNVVVDVPDTGEVSDILEMIPGDNLEKKTEESIVVVDVPDTGEVSDILEMIPGDNLEKKTEESIVVVDVPDIGEVSDILEMIPGDNLEKKTEESNVVVDVPDTGEVSDILEMIPGDNLENKIKESNMIVDVSDTGKVSDFLEMIPGDGLVKKIEESNGILNVPDTRDVSDILEVIPGDNLEKKTEEPNVIADVTDTGKVSDFLEIIPIDSPDTREISDFFEIIPVDSLNQKIEESNVIVDLPDTGKVPDFLEMIPGDCLEKKIEKSNILVVPDTGDGSDIREMIPRDSLEKKIEESNVITDVTDTGKVSDFLEMIPGDSSDTGKVSDFLEIIPEDSLEKKINESNVIVEVPGTEKVTDFLEMIPGDNLEKKIEESNGIVEVPDIDVSDILEIIPGDSLEKKIDKSNAIVYVPDAGDVFDILEMIPGDSHEKKIEESNTIIDVPDAVKKHEVKEYEDVTGEILEDTLTVTSTNLSVSQNHDNYPFNSTCNIRRSSAGDVSNVTELKPEPSLLKYNSLEWLSIQENEKSNLCCEIETIVEEKFIPPISLELDKRFFAVISHLENDGSLWIQLCDDIPALCDMMEKLNDFSFDSLEHIQGLPVVGSIYACLCSEDGRLYRASLKSVCQDSRCVVHYVDYGCEDIVRVDDLRKIPECCIHIPIQAAHCYFSKTTRENWSESYQRQIEMIKGKGEVSVQVSIDDSDCDHFVFKEFCYGNQSVSALFQETRVVEIRTLDNSRSTVSLEDIDSDSFGEKGVISESFDESSVTQLKRAYVIHDLSVDDCEIKTELPVASDQDSDQQFALHNLETNDEVYVQSTFDKLVNTPEDSERSEKLFSAVISHIENDGSLWLQTYDQLSALHDMRTKLNELPKSSLELFTKDIDNNDCLYLCDYTPDELLYRVAVKKLLNDQNLAVVRYIDYGYEECVKVDDLRKIPENFANIPMQAVHCYFSNHIRENWSDYCQQLIIGIKSKVSVCVVSDPEGENNLILKELRSEDLDVVRMLSANIQRTTDHEVLCLDSHVVDIKNGTMRETQPGMKMDSEQCRNEEENAVAVSCLTKDVTVLNKPLDGLSEKPEVIYKQIVKSSDEVLGIKGNESNLLISFDSGEESMPKLDEISLFQQQDVFDDYDFDDTVSDSMTVEDKSKSSKENEDNCNLGIKVCPTLSEAGPIMKEADGSRCINETTCVNKKYIDKEMKEELSEHCFLSPNSGNSSEKVKAAENLENLVDFMEIQAEKSSNVCSSNEEKIYLEEASARNEVFYNNECEAVDDRLIKTEQGVFVSNLTDEPFMLKNDDLFDLDEHSFTAKSCCFNVLEQELQNLAIDHGKEFQSPLSEGKPKDVYNEHRVCSSLEHIGTDKFSGEKTLTDLCLDEHSVFQATAETGNVCFVSEKNTSESDKFCIVSEKNTSESDKFCKEREADESEKCKYVEDKLACSSENVTFHQESIPQVESALSKVQSHDVIECLEHDTEVVKPEKSDCFHDDCRIGPGELDMTCRSCHCVKIKKSYLHEKTLEVGAQSLLKKEKAFALQPRLVSGSEVFIKDVHTSGCLYLYLKKDLGRLSDIQQSLRESSEQLQAPQNILPGMACVAESKDGETWHRATVLHVEEGKANIQCVDDGKTEIVSQEKLKEIPTNLLDPPFLYICNYKPKDTSYKPKDTSFDRIRSSAMHFFEKPLVLTAEDGEGEQMLTFQYCGEEVLEDFYIFSYPMSESEELASVDLPTCCRMTGSEVISSVDVDSTPQFDWSLDKTKSFLHSIDEDDEDSDESSVIQHYKALVVNVEENPFSLWVQKEEDFNLVTLITKTLANGDVSLEGLQHPEKGQLCLCIFKGVKQRAKLISYDDNTALVHYIDLGKYDMVSRQELYELALDLIDIHPLASQVFLPVAINKGMESVSGAAITEVALAKLCFCIDVRTLTDRKIKTIVVSDGIGDLGEFLVTKDLATHVSFDTHVKEEVTILVNNFCQALAKVP